MRCVRLAEEANLEYSLSTIIIIIIIQDYFVVSVEIFGYLPQFGWSWPLQMELQFTIQIKCLSIIHHINKA